VKGLTCRYLFKIKIMMVVAIFRTPEARHFEQASDVLCNAGVACHEYALTTEGAFGGPRRVPVEGCTALCCG
jgi:2-keto-3-deoxy-6-phosphogluconate aldolase